MIIGIDVVVEVVIVVEVPGVTGIVSLITAGKPIRKLSDLVKLLTMFISFDVIAFKEELSIREINTEYLPGSNLGLKSCTSNNNEFM